MYTYCARCACGPTLASRDAGVYPGTLRGPIMSRRTLQLTLPRRQGALRALPPIALLLLSVAFGAAGCAGTDTTDEGGRKPPEICNDEIDNDEDGLVDCDDSAECGGLQCNTGTTDTDTGPTVDLPPAEILFSSKSCCDFTFAAGECPKMIGTYQAANREPETDGELDASCDLIGDDPPLEFSVDGCPNCPIPYLTNQQVDPNTTVTVEVWFDCAVQQTFEATCRTNIEVSPFEDEWEFQVNGVRADP
jgi:hypothetical protein